MVNRGPETLTDFSTLPAVTLRVSIEKETLEEEEKPRAGGFATPTVFCVWSLLGPPTPALDLSQALWQLH